MSHDPEPVLSEIAVLTRVLSGYASEEGESTLSRSLAAMADAAHRASGAVDASTAKLEIAEAYRALYAPKEGGLGNFFRWHSDFDTRMRLNDELKHVQERLWQLLGSA